MSLAIYYTTVNVSSILKCKIWNNLMAVIICIHSALVKQKQCDINPRSNLYVKYSNKVFYYLKNHLSSHHRDSAPTTFFNIKVDRIAPHQKGLENQNSKMYACIASLTYTAIEN